MAGFVVYGSSTNTRPASQNALAANQSRDAVVNPLDQVSSADIAAHLAIMVRMDETVAVINNADSINAQLSIVSADEKLVAKPQIVSTALKSRKDIITYTVVSGDTISSLAAKFNVTSDSIKWSNDLSTETLNAGTVIRVLPGVNGIIYKVASGDTPDKLAREYNANKDSIIAYNDAEVAGLTVGEYIVIPDGIKLAPRRTATYGGGFAWGASAIYGYNGYDYGYCTWYVANKRTSIGRPVPANLGDAWTWDDRAAIAGLTVNRTPAAGAVAVTDSYRRPGHVSFVEQVFEDGSIRVSEMNVRGWGVRSERTFPASSASSFNYIH